MPLNNGDQIAGKCPYQVIRRIGEGGMSNIYLCQALLPPGAPGEGHWVLKEMTVSYRDPKDQENARTLFIREAELLMQLRHRNLPRVLEHFENGNHYYTVMEYVEGEDLGKLLLRNPQGFPESRVATWGVEVATVLYYLHSQRDEKGVRKPIIFRDLKPSNIMISHGQVKLIDFGIARRFDAFKKKDTMRIGSPGYAPPEAYGRQTNERSDIYSLGVTLHQLLTGRDPAETQSAFTLPPVRSLKPQVSQAMEQLIVTATALEPENRFKNALEMKRALQALLGVASQSGPLPSRGGTVPVGSGPLPSVTLGAASRPGPQASGAVPAVSASLPSVASAPVAAPPTVVPRGSPVPAPRPVVVPPVAATDARSAVAVPPPPRMGPPALSPVLPASTRPPQAPSAGLPSRASRSPASTSRPTSRGGFRRFLFLVMLAVTAGLYYDPLSRALFDILPSVFHRHRVAEVRETYTPVSTLVSPLTRGFMWIEDGYAPTALDFFADARAADRSDAVALLGYNDALALSAPHVRTVFCVGVVFAGSPLGRDWLRGVALAQRAVNAQGGVGGHPLLLLPYEVNPRTFDPIQTVADARQRRVQLFLAALPDGASARLSAAALHANLAVLTSLPRTVADTQALGASTAALSRTLADLSLRVAHPRTVAVVASLRWPEVDVVAAESVFRKASVVVRRFAATDNPSAIARAKPDLVLFLGDAWDLDSFANLSRSTRLGAPVWAADASFTTQGALGALSRSGRLWALTRWKSQGQDALESAFSMSYMRTYADARNTVRLPGPYAVAGHDEVVLMARAQGALTPHWTTASLVAALAAAGTGPLSSISAGPVQPMPGYLVHMEVGGDVFVKAVSY